MNRKCLLRAHSMVLYFLLLLLLSHLLCLTLLPFLPCLLSLLFQYPGVPLLLLTDTPQTLSLIPTPYSLLFSSTSMFHLSTLHSLPSLQSCFPLTPRSPFDPNFLLSACLNGDNSVAISSGYESGSVI